MPEQQITEKQLVKKLQAGPVDFHQVMQLVDSLYDFNESAFKNGELQNAEGQNNGSCKLFSFAKIHNLSEQATLNAFGDFYTQDVLQNPLCDDHQNIRNFIKFGWQGVEFEKEALVRKAG